MSKQSFCINLVIVALFMASAVRPADAQSTAEAIYQSSLPLFADSSSTALTPQVISTGSFPESSWQKISYLGKISRLSGLLFLPHGAKAGNSVPCLLLLHGLGGRKEQMIPVARFFAAIGYASWMIDDAGSGERAPAPGQMPHYPDLSSLAAGITDQSSTTIVDLRRGIDYLETRPELDHTHIAAVGFSLGALISSVLGGVDNRVCAVILVSGGGNLGQLLTDEEKTNVAFGKIYQSLLAGADPDNLEQLLAPIDPINYVAHISPRPLLMEHGRLDKIISPESAEALYNAANQPKKIIWFPAAGHIPPPFDIYPSISEFLDEYLPTAGR